MLVDFTEESKMKQFELDIEAQNDLLLKIYHTMALETKTEQHFVGANATLVKLQLPLAESANNDRYSQTD